MSKVARTCAILLIAIAASAQVAYADTQAPAVGGAPSTDASATPGATSPTLSLLTDAPAPVPSKRIVVSLSQQKLDAYEDDRVVLETPVTTGGPYLPTPVGTFSVMRKYSPYLFRSPWPQGSPFWYADAVANTAMQFAAGGYFLHDAPWRRVFGPGSNAQYGTPGGDYTGTHGCVNVPLQAELRIFAWADVGVPVLVQK